MASGLMNIDRTAAMEHIITNTMIGVGMGTSASYGAKIVANLPKVLQIP